MKPQTIQIFLPEGSPTSVKEAELTNRLIKTITLITLIALISQILIGCGLTAKYKQNQNGIAETIEFNKVKDHSFTLKQVAQFTKYGVEPPPESVLKESSHRMAYDTCGSFREIKKIRFKPVTAEPLTEKSIYKHQVTLQSLIECLDMSGRLDYGMRKTFVDNKNLEVIMTAYEVEFETGFDITQFLEDEFKFHADVFCEENGGIDSIDFFVNEGYAEYTLPTRHSLLMFILDGSIVCE